MIRVLVATRQCLNRLALLASNLLLLSAVLGFSIPAAAQSPTQQSAQQPTQAPPSTVLRVGIYDNPPKLFVNPDGEPDGIFWRLLSRMASESNWQLQPVVCEWNDCLQQLERGQLDLMPDVASSDARALRFDFHQEPALFSWSQMYERPGTGILNLLDLDGRRLAILEGSIQREYLEELLPGFGVSPQWVVLNDLDHAFEAVVQGEADAVVSNHYYGDLRAAELGLDRTPVIFQPAQLYFAVPSGRHALISQAINVYLTQWKSDPNSPYFDALRPFQPLGEENRLSPVLIWSLVATTVALLFALGFSALLRMKVTEKTRSLIASENRLNTILNSVEAYIYIKDHKLRYQYANRKVCDLFGVPADQIIGKTDAAFFDQATCEHLYENDIKVLRAGERVADEESNILASDQQRHEFISVKLPLRNPDGSIYALCGISTDVTEHKQIRNQLHQLAFFDALTGLPNRRLVLDRLDHAMASRQKTGYEGALLLIDLDHFKTVNDTLGHEIGDLLLQQVARRIERGLLNTDSAGRLGADEFVLIVEDVALNPDDALVRVRDMAEFLRNQLSQPFDLRGTEYVCSVSVGVAMFTDAGNDTDALLKGADLALAAAKSSGRNMVRFFNPEMQIEVTRRTRIENALRKAIEHNTFVLFLQPQMDSTGTTVSMEALLRLTDPALGEVPPGDFVPVAETSGLIVPLGEWVITHACELLAQWQQLAQLRSLSLAVNVSPRQFHHPEFADHVIGCLEKYKLPGASLVLEVTESLLIDDVDATVQKMQVLGAHGIQFALDDFGTGYASLSYLKRLPLTQLKIDQSFVRDLLVDQNDEAIVKTIIALGNSLEMQVVAEGVETQEQASRLQQMGCAFFQGYYFGRPQPAERWPEILSGQASGDRA